MGDIILHAQTSKGAWQSNARGTWNVAPVVEIEPPRGHRAIYLKVSHCTPVSRRYMHLNTVPPISPNHRTAKTYRVRQLYNHTAFR
jgi:hypothetical protein